MKKQRNILKQLFCVALSAVMLCSCAPERVTKSDSSMRIVSLGPAQTEGLYLLGADAKLVGCTVYCQRPAAAKKKAKVGNVVKMDLEKVVALRPSLVIATSFTNPDDIEKLEKMGIEVVTFAVPESFAKICENFERLGRLVGKEARAEEIVARAETSIETIMHRVKGLQKTKTMIQVGADPLVVVGRKTFTSDYIDLAGGVNTVSAEGYIRYSMEQVLKDNPEAIIVFSMNSKGKNAKKTWQQFQTLSAVANSRIYTLDADKTNTPTPLVFAPLARTSISFWSRMDNGNFGRLRGPYSRFLGAKRASKDDGGVSLREGRERNDRGKS